MKIGVVITVTHLRNDDSSLRTIRKLGASLMNYYNFIRNLFFILSLCCLSSACGPNEEPSQSFDVIRPDNHHIFFGFDLRPPFHNTTDCTACHREPNAEDFRITECTNCHIPDGDNATPHSADETNGIGAHLSCSNYAFASAGCRFCHPVGLRAGAFDFCIQ